MEIKDIKFILEVARSGSISKAANNLYMAQPNLSNLIIQLENELGFKIFERTNRGVVPTEKGSNFLMQGAKIIKEFDELTSVGKQNDAMQHELSVISVRSSYVCAAISMFMNRQIDRDVQLNIQFSEVTNIDVIKKLVLGEFGLGILRPSNINLPYLSQLAKSYELDFINLKSLKYVVLMSVHHPLAHNDVISVDELANYTEIVHVDYERNMISIKDFINTPWQSKNIVKVCDRGSLLDLVSSVKGAFMWTTGTHSQALKDYNLVEIPCDFDTEYMSMDRIIYKRNKVFTKFEEEFIDILINQQGRN